MQIIVLGLGNYFFFGVIFVGKLLFFLENKYMYELMFL